jgi:hypothetical protein
VAQISNSDTGNFLRFMMSFSVVDKWPLPTSSDHSESDVFWVNKSNLTRQRDTYPFIDPYRFKNILRHKVVVVTLAHRGVGKTTANAFAAAGASVVVVGPSAQALQTVMIEIREKYGTPTLALTADVLDPHAPERIVHLTEKHLGPVDVLINLSPSAYMRPFTQEQGIMTDWWPLVEKGVRTPVAMINAVLPSMISRHTGIIITVTSVAGILNSKNIPHSPVLHQFGQIVRRFYCPYPPNSLNDCNFSVFTC